MVGVTSGNPTNEFHLILATEMRRNFTDAGRGLQYFQAAPLTYPFLNELLPAKMIVWVAEIRDLNAPRMAVGLVDGKGAERT